MTKTSIPTGGVIMPSSITIIATGPNLVGSILKPVSIGKTIGSVMTSIDKPALNMPRTI
ncbi:hypothetical protein R2601_20701 [Salipiger bermudensis HTCC2601]|uniref:Uncharacterized protein n=1 Tax=Salipiger bermudensis (strain DSM 26914 / JCM 13377 / KCTC 12554 / HTCC2601) TaxID=314265 RepID=Q0FNN9_SALBH|nr:hypothetical protein R2601_20701 [Salipiger bermudensis HTCC2601]